MKNENFLTRFNYFNARLLITTCVIIATCCNLSAQNVTVNPGAGSYPTLAAALAAINAGTHTGAVTVDIVNSTAEVATVFLNASGAGSASYTSVLIEPVNDNITVTGTGGTAKSLVLLNGADNVTIDGDNPNTAGINRNLSFINSNAAATTATAVIRMGSAPSPGLGIINVIIRNCILKGNTTGGAIGTTTEFGIFAGLAVSASATAVPTTTPALTTGAGPYANITIQNNLITTCANAVWMGGNGAGIVSGLNINNNTIGSATAANYVFSCGIQLNGCTSAIVNKNTLLNIIGAFASSTTGSGATMPRGIDIATNGSANTISNNIINNVQNVSTSGYGARGISTYNGNNHVIYNNFVSGVKLYENASTLPTYGAAGIYINAGTGHNVSYNSVSCQGAALGGSSGDFANLFISSAGSTGMTIKNNIFDMEITSSATSKIMNVGFGANGTSSMNLTWNNNAYFLTVSGATFGFGYNYGTTAYYTTFSALSAYTSTLSGAGTNDNASVSSTTAPPFISSTDLHIDNTIGNASLLYHTGSPVSGITTDIDGTTRHLTTPDIGAHEFTLPACAGIPNPGNTVASTNPICSGTPFSLSLQNSTSGAGVTYQWQSADDASFTINLNNLGIGSSLVTSQTSAKYYRCYVICTTGPDTTISNPLQVSMNPFQNCYCTPNYSSGVEPITSVSFAGINNSSAQTGGPSLEDFTNITGIVALGTSYPITVKGNTVGSFTDSIRVWIDFNHNGSFTDAGESFNLGIITNTTGIDAISATGNILIPNSALTGVTRMRVTKLYNSSGVNLPCVSSGYGQAEDYSLLIASSSACTAPPTPGNTISSINPVCPSVSFTLSLQNLTAESGITYQWQSADDAGFTINLANLSTSSSQVTSQTSAKYYRCLVTCATGPFTTASTPVQVTMNAFTNCYCVPNNSSGCSGGDIISNVTFAGINRNSICDVPNYGYYSTFTANVTGATSYNLSVTTGTGASGTSDGVAVWIDYNQNGIFEASEKVFAGYLGVSPATYNASVTIPVSALGGATRMRVRNTYAGSPTDACSDQTWGETEDYPVNVTLAPQCTGTPATPVAAAQQAQVCTSNPVAQISISGYTSSVIGITHQWKSSPTQGGPYTNIPGATSDTYTSGTLSAATYYVCLDSCIYSQQTAQSNEVAITIVDPQITGTTPGSRCGAGTINLSATASSGSSIDWYSAASGGSPLYSGSPFTTPVIGTTTTYYVSASIGGSNYGGGKPSSNGADGTNTEGGIFFTASQQFTLNSVVMYPTGAGTNTIVLYAGSVSSGTAIYSFTANFSGASTTGVTVPLGWSISPGNYTIYSTGGTASCWRDYSSSSVPPIAYPYNIGPACTLTDGSLSGYYYFFFNWSISTGCVSSRTPVIASVSLAPTISVSSSPTICSGLSTVLSVSSSNDPNYKYTWTPGSLNGSSVSVSPATTTTYTVSALDTTGGSNQGCANSGTVLVNVNPSPTNVMASINNPICLNSLVTLNTSANPYNNTILSSNFNSGAQGWSSINNGGNAATIFTLRPNGYNIPTYGLAPLHSNDNSQFYLSNSSASTGNTRAILQSPSFSTMNYTTCNVSFYQYYKFWTAGDSILIEASTNGTTWSIVKVYPNADIGDYANFIQDNVNLNAYVNQPIVYIRFRYRAAFSYWWAIDNVVISGNIANFTYAWSSTPSGYSSVAKTPPPFAPNTSISSYSVMLTNIYGCTRTASTGSLSYVTPPKPYLTVKDTSICSNNSGFNIYVKDSGAYSGGYPAGTTFEFVGYTVAGTEDSLFVNSSGTYQVNVNLPPYIVASCPGTTAISNINFGTDAPQVSLSSDSVRCRGTETGKAIAAIVFGGVPRYRWRWYNSSGVLKRDVTTNLVSDTLNGMPEGMYTLVITDHQDSATSPYCEVTDSVFISQPAAVLSSTENVVLHSNPLCNNASTGTAAVITSGGTPPYSYSWSNGASTQMAGGLHAGVYTCTITDSRGCTTTVSVTITQPSAISPNCTSTNATCFNGSNGTASVSATGGTGGYSYLWSNGITTSSPGSLPAGSYTVTVTDANGCTMQCTSTISQPAQLVATITGNTGICAGSSNTLNAGGGYSNYSWSTGATTQTISVSTAGTYTVTVTNGSGCTGTGSVTTVVNPVPVPTISGASAVCTSSSTLIIASGGFNAYSWSTGATTQSINAPGGTYTVTVTNGNGCTGTATKTIAITGSVPAQPGVITGSTAVCKNSDVTYSIAAVPGATDYTWSANSGATVTSGQGTTTVVVSLSNSAASSTLSVVANNVCGPSIARTLSYTVSSVIPGSPSTITGTLYGVCNQTLTYSCPAVANATSYQWSVPAGGTIMSGQGTNTVSVKFITFTAAGTISVYAQSGCGNSTATSKTVDSKPQQPVISGQNWACKGQAGLNYSVAAVAGATSYTWTIVSGSTLVSGQGTPSIVVNWGSINGVIKCIANNACGSSLPGQLSVSFTCREAGDLFDFSDINLFPNPASTSATIQFDAYTEGSGQLFVYDLIGKEVLSKNLHIVNGQNQFLLDLSNLPAGAYAVKVVYNGLSRNRKLIVE